MADLLKFTRTTLTGGGATAVDGINATALTGNEICWATVSDVLHTYRLNATSGAAADGVNIIIPVVGTVGDKRWILESVKLANGSALGTPASGTLTNCTTATASDNDADTSLASTAFVKSQIANDSNPKAMAQGVALTAAASGSSGITVADDDNLDMGTGNFTLIWKGSLPDWTPGTKQTLMRKKEPGANSGLVLSVNTDGTLVLDLYNVADLLSYTSTIPTGFVDGTIHEITVPVTRQTATVAGKVQFFFDAVQGGIDIAIAAATPYSLDGIASMYWLGTDAIRTAGTVHSAYLINRAYSPADVLNHYRNGLAEADKWGSQTSLVTGNDSDMDTIGNWIASNNALVTSVAGGESGNALQVQVNGTGYPGARLNKPTIIGKKYKFRIWGKDVLSGTAKVFVGSTAGGAEYGYYLSFGVGAFYELEFTATVTTCYLENIVHISSGAGSETALFDTCTLIQLGATLALDSESWQSDKPYDCSSNNLTCAYPATGWSLTRPNNIGLPVLTNLLGNSGFSIWSNGTAENVGSDLAVNGNFQSGDSDWTKSVGWTIEDVGAGDYQLIATNTSTTTKQAYAGFVIGKLYKVVATCANYTDGSFVAYADTGIGSQFGNEVSSTAASTLIFEATATSHFIGVSAFTAGSDFKISSITLYEVTPGCVVANTLGPDGWMKTGSAAYPDIWRQHYDATYTKAGSFYAVKMTVAAGTTGVLVWNPGQLATEAANPDSSIVRKFVGQTVAFGAWLYATAASNVRLRIGETHMDFATALASSAYHTGAAGWEWVEVTATFTEAMTKPAIGFEVAAGATAYFSQPMLVYGSKIGQGNYQPIPGEVIWLEARSTLVNGSIATGATILNVEALSSGAIGKGAKAVTGFIVGKNTAAEKYLKVCDSSSEYSYNPMYSQVANVYAYNTFNIRTSTTGDVTLLAQDANWSSVLMRVTAVQL
jgi:hypothetical protein